MSERDQLVKTYIGRVLSLQQHKKEQLQQEELKAIARELGLSGDEIAEVEKEASDHFERGQGFVRYARWDDAINELKEARSCSPLRLDILHELALAHHSRYKEKQQRSDREEAQRLAKQTLELNPKHEPSFALLNALDQKPSSKSSSIGAALLLGLLIVPVIAGVGYLSSRDPGPGAALSARSPATPLSTAPPYVPPPPTNNDVELPVEFEAGEKGEGLVFHNRGTILNNYPGSSFLNVIGELENTGRREYSQIKLQMQLLDAQGVVVETIVVEPLSSYQAPIRPQDTKGFHSLKQTSPTITKLKLSVQLATHQPAPSSYDEPKEITPEWSFAKPSHVQLFVGERATKFDPPSYGGTVYHEAWLIFENRGEGAISQLKVQLSFYDKEDNLISTDESYVVSSSEPSLLPGQRRPLHTIEPVNIKFARYAVSIIEAR